MSASRVATGGRSTVGPQRAMSIPEKNYMYDHKAMGDKSPKDGVTSLRSKVAQLKHVFQGEGDAGGSPRHNVSSPSPRSPDHALLKMRSKSLSDQPAKRTELIDPTGMEPQKYFEATNHVERFRYTRAIFAQMEEKSRLEQDKARILQQHHNQNRALSPNQERKRASSDASVMDDVNGQRSHRTGGTLMDGRKHLGSMDSLDDNGGNRGCQRQAKLLHEMSHSEGDLSRDLSRDLSHEKSRDVQHMESPWASKRAMSSQEQPVERQVQHSMRGPSSGERTSSSEHSLPPSYSQHIREKRAAAAAAAAAAASVSKVTSTAVVTMANSNKQPELPQYPDSVAVDTATVATVTSSSHSKRDAKPELPPYPSRSVTSSSVVRLGNATSSPTRTTQDGGGDDRPQVVMRRSHVNRENRDAYGLILLPKRRSRDDARLSKEEIEASLSQADRYWRESADSTGATDAVATMMDSTHSSGSGEEMAHSDSGHNLSHSPTDHNAAQKAWAAMYALNSDTECREGEPTSLDQTGDRTSHRLSMDSNVEEVIALSSPAVPKDEVLEEPFRHHNRSPSPQHIAMERHSTEEAALDLARQEEKESRSSVTKTTLEDWITQGNSSNTDMSSSMVAKDEEENSTDL